MQKKKIYIYLCQTDVTPGRGFAYAAVFASHTLGGPGAGGAGPRSSSPPRAASINYCHGPAAEGHTWVSQSYSGGVQGDADEG